MMASIMVKTSPGALGDALHFFLQLAHGVAAAALFHRGKLRKVQGLTCVTRY